MYRIALVGIVVLALTSCKKPSSHSIQIAGSTTVLPVVSAAAEKFNEKTGVRIIVNAGGSGVGVNQMAEGQVDIGMISRDVSSDEEAKFPKVNFNTITIGRDAVVPVVSSEIYDEGITHLTLMQVASIYKGEIKNWKDIGGPDRKILVLDKEKSRGTRHVFMEVVMGDKNADAPGASMVLGANNEEQTALAQSDAAIGMLSQAWMNKDVKGIAITLDDGTSIEPNMENIKKGAYPISRNLCLLVNGTPEGDVKKFIDYLLSDEGQKIVEEQGFVRVD